jgi:hypothetical protein
MTLQDQYLLIKEGKGDKNFFLKQARLQFPNWLTVHNDFDTAVNILKNKSILSEAEVKAVNKEVEKSILDLETKNYDYKNKKNIDNLYGQSFLNGFYAEMKDPANESKTVEQLKDIIAKNMAKDVNYYSKNAMFGIKGLKGEQLDEPKAPKGKYKSSGYGDLKESINEIGMFLDPTGYDSNRKSQMQLAREILADAGMPKEEIEAFISDNMFRPGRLSDKAREYVSSMELNTEEGKLKESIKDFFKK